MLPIYRTYNKSIGLCTSSKWVTKSPYESSIEEAKRMSQDESLVVQYESMTKEIVNAAAHMTRSRGREVW